MGLLRDLFRKGFQNSWSILIVLKIVLIDRNRIPEKIKSEPAGEYLCVADGELTFQKYSIDNQYWEINNNRIYFGTDRRICLSINSNNDQQPYTLAEAQVSPLRIDFFRIATNRSQRSIPIISSLSKSLTCHM